MTLPTWVPMIAKKLSSRLAHTSPFLVHQTGLPMTGLAVVAGELRLAAPLRKELNTVFLPWALQAGSHAADLMCIYYEQHLEVGEGGGGQLLPESGSARSCGPTLELCLPIDACARTCVQQ